MCDGHLPEGTHSPVGAATAAVCAIPGAGDEACLLQSCGREQTSSLAGTKAPPLGVAVFHLGEGLQNAGPKIYLDQMRFLSMEISSKQKTNSKNAKLANFAEILLELGGIGRLCFGPSSPTPTAEIDLHLNRW